MARLYANENFPLATVEELRRLGHDVLTTADAGQSGAAVPDDQVLAAATSQQRVVLTFNRRDFIQLHQKQPRHAEIIVCTFDADFPGLAGRIHDAIGSVPDRSGQLLRVYRKG
jgi:hypothetical protein